MTVKRRGAETDLGQVPEVPAPPGDRDGPRPVRPPGLASVGRAHIEGTPRDQAATVITNADYVAKIGPRSL